jgi:D-alanyl-D-alanine carboxypeptidase/D-alanyl-D-alanine-endopeptidase (penicillin-binding protein 4)
MTRIKSYAGYVKSASGKNLCFAIIVNNHTCSGVQIKKKLEKIMVSLGNYYN